MKKLILKSNRQSWLTVQRPQKISRIIGFHLLGKAYMKSLSFYSKKMWQVDDNKIIDDFAWSPKGVALKEGKREAWDVAISVILMQKMDMMIYFNLSTQDTDVRLNCSIESYDICNKSIKIEGKKYNFDIIISTISPDIIMNKVYGELPYIGREFHKFVLPTKFAFRKTFTLSTTPRREKFTSC